MLKKESRPYLPKDKKIWKWKFLICNKEDRACEKKKGCFQILGGCNGPLERAYKFFVQLKQWVKNDACDTLNRVLRSKW